MKTCSQYVGVTCVNGTCPNALADEYPEMFEKVKCKDCFHNKGCEDCAFAGENGKCEIDNILISQYKPKQIQRAIELMENEVQCVKRNEAGGCDRQCGECDLVVQTEEVLSAYNLAIYSLNKLLEKERGECETSEEV